MPDPLWRRNAPTNSLRQAGLTPDQAVNVFNDRLALISKVNADIADWLQVSAFTICHSDKTNTSYRSAGRSKKHMS